MESTCTRCTTVIDSNSATFRKLKDASTDPDQLPLFNWPFWVEEKGRGVVNPELHYFNYMQKDVKHLCPSCARLFREEIKQEKRLQCSISVGVILVFIMFASTC